MKAGMEAVPESTGELLSDPQRRIFPVLHFLFKSLAIAARFVGQCMGSFVGQYVGRMAGGYTGVHDRHGVGHAKAALTMINRISLGGAKALMVIEFNTSRDSSGGETAQAAGQRFLVAVNADAVTSILSIDSSEPPPSHKPYPGRLLPNRRLSGVAGSVRTSSRRKRSRSAHQSAY